MRILLDELRLTLAVVSCVILAAGCGRTLNAVRAEPPMLQLPSVAEQRQEATARCIQDRIYEEMSSVWSVVQETRREPDGWHVIGRPSVSPTFVVWDVAVTSASIEVRLGGAPPFLPRGTVVEAVKWCVARNKQ